MNWFVFYVQGRKEHTLSNLINKNKDVVAFVPMMERKHSKQGVFRIIEKELFPGYLFLKTEKDQSFIESLFFNSRQRTSGIKKFLKVDAEGTNALKDTEVNFLETMLDDSYVLRMSRGVIIDGKLQIQEGPLKGREQDIKWINRHKCLCCLYVEMLGKEVLVSLEIKVKID